MVKRMYNQQEYDKLKAENENYKKLAEKHLVDYFEVKAENEELKKLIKRQSDVLINEIGKADEYQDDYVFMKTENEKYKQALDEIEQLIKNNEKVRILSQTDEFVTVETIQNVDYKKILDIIAKAKGEE